MPGELPADLKNLIRSLVGDEPPAVQALAHNRWLTAGISRIVAGGRSMIVKRLVRPTGAAPTAWDAHWVEGAERPRHWNFWEREALVYEHRIPKLYGGRSIGAPRLIAIDRDADRIDCVLEDVRGRPGESWTIPEYAAASRALGRGQGRFLAGEPIPSHRWLSTGFLRDYSTEKPVDWDLLDDDGAWAQPLVRDHFPPGLRDSARRMHDAREELYALMSSLPRTLCHLDFWSKNLIRRPSGEIVAVDWSFTGDGAVGEDPGNMVPDAVFDHFLPPEALPDLDREVFRGYLDGLTDAGWRGDARLVRLGMCASAIKYDWLTPAMLGVAGAERYPAYGGTHLVDASVRFRDRGAGLAFVTAWADEALALAHDLRLG